MIFGNTWRICNFVFLKAEQAIRLHQVEVVQSNYNSTKIDPGDALSKMTALPSSAVHEWPNFFLNCKFFFHEAFW